MGVAQRAGTERISHLVRSKFNKIRLGDDLLILKVDFRNAFNGVSRDAMLALTRKYFPRLFRWVEWCYANTYILTFDAWEILSCEGVQQGDPLGPLLFSLVLQEVVKKIHDSIPTLKLNKWYLDDGVIIGTKAELQAVLKILSEEGPKLGLILNPKKCEIIFKQKDAKRNSGAPSLSAGVPLSLSSVRSCFPEPIKIIQTNDTVGLEILGTPIGPTLFCEKFIREKTLKDIKKGISAITQIDDPQVALHVL